ncbi:MAG: zinc ribbon domain-containing protein [Nitrososphaerota archaeon]
MVAEENARPVMEELTHIRERIRYGRVMNRRLHSIPFRKIQLYISYKSMEHGFKPETVDAKNTSRTCPICGEISKPNGHVFKCRRCGFQSDRHLVAAWNIAMKLPMCRPLPLAAKATNELKEVEWIVIKKVNYPTTVRWYNASDLHSGVYGFSILWSNAPTIPDTTVDVANTSLTSPHYLMVLVPQ